MLLGLKCHCEIKTCSVQNWLTHKEGDTNTLKSHSTLRSCQLSQQQQQLPQPQQQQQQLNPDAIDSCTLRSETFSSSCRGGDSLHPQDSRMYLSPTQLSAAAAACHDRQLFQAAAERDDRPAAAAAAAGYYRKGTSVDSSVPPPPIDIIAAVRKDLGLLN